MEARLLCALLALALLVGQVAGFSQFPGAASEGGDLRASRMSYSSGGSADPGVDDHQRRKSIGLSGVDFLGQKGGATGCSYMRPSDKTGCPMLRSGCIRLTVGPSGQWGPVPGQCAIFKEDVESVCGGDPMCGGVVCRHTYEFMGKLYCLARWGIDEDAIDSGPSNERRYAFRRREAVRNYQGGATGCSYKRPGNSCGCPQLLNGCIEPPPVPGQCAIYENDVVSVCGGDAICGGVVCREDYKHDGKQYCLARWGIDDTKSDSSRPDDVALVAAGRGCGEQVKNLGTTFSTPYLCGEAAAADASCGSTFMYPKGSHARGTPRWATWGCRCCVGNGEGGNANSNWNVYAVVYTNRRWAFALDPPQAYATFTSGAYKTFAYGDSCEDNLAVSLWTPADCSAAATALNYLPGLTGRWDIDVAVNVRSVASGPSYCSIPLNHDEHVMHWGTFGYNTLWFNHGTEWWTECGDDFVDCICKERIYQGGATSCAYGRPSCKTGCPQLSSGCIEPAPEPGQCAMLEKDVESVCGADPACGGVVCSRRPRATSTYCFARWAIDETATDNVHWSYTRVPSCTFIRGLEPGPLPAATPPRPARYTDRAPPRRRSEARDGR